MDEAEAHYRVAPQLLSPMDEPINKATALFYFTGLTDQRKLQSRTATLEQLQQALQLRQSGDSQLLVLEIQKAIKGLGV